MALSAAQYSEMVKFFGQERADELIRQGETMSATLIAAGIAYKSKQQEQPTMNSFTAAITQTMKAHAEANSQSGKKAYWQALAKGITPEQQPPAVDSGVFWSNIASAGKAIQARNDEAQSQPGDSSSAFEWFR